MAARQLWLFLTAKDVESLLAVLDAREPGLIWSQGRYLRGDPSDLLAGPSKLERRESLAANLPRTSVDFIRIGQDALDRAKAGTLRLTYLYRPIAPVKVAGDAVVAPPPGAIGEDVPDEG